MDRDRPESAETLTPRTVLGWSAAGFCFLVLAYFAGVVVIPTVQAHRAAFDAGNTITEGCFWKNFGEEAVAELGGPERAARYLSISMRFSSVPAAEAMLLGACGRHGVPPLVRALDSDDSFTSEWAARSLAYLGPDAAPAVPALVRMLQSGRNTGWAAHALGKIGPSAAPAVPALEKCLADESEWVRGAAAEALGGIGPLARSSLPLLLQALNDQSPHVRVSAAKALGRMGAEPEKSVPALAKCLRTSLAAPATGWDCHQEDLCEAAAKALAAFGPAFKEVVPVLAECLLVRRELARVRQVAAQALAEMGAAAEPAVPALIRALDLAWDDLVCAPGKGGISRPVDGREAIVVALGKIGPAAKPAVPALTDAVRWGWGAGPPLQLRILEVLGAIGPAAYSERLADDLWYLSQKSDNAEVRAAACDALAKIGVEVETPAKEEK